VHGQATDFISDGIDIVAIAATIEAMPARMNVVDSDNVITMPAKAEPT
jgi:hypothetical protein